MSFNNSQFKDISENGSEKSCPVLIFIQILIYIFNTHLSDFFQLCLWLLTLIQIRNNSHHFKKDLVPYQKRKMKEKYEN